MGAFFATTLHNVGPGRHAFGIRGRKGDALTGHRSSSVQSVERAISILRSFSLEKPERGVGERGRELGLHKSTVSRLMMTLERGGLLSRNPVSKRYRLGIDLLGLAAQVAANIDVREAARPILRRLAEACQESVNLSVLDIPPQDADRLAQVVNLEQFVPLNTRSRISAGLGGAWPPIAPPPERCCSPLSLPGSSTSRCRLILTGLPRIPLPILTNFVRRCAAWPVRATRWPGRSSRRD